MLKLIEYTIEGEQMDTFKEYKVADITEEDREQITKLEQNISTEKEKKVVLIAYEKE